MCRIELFLQLLISYLFYSLQLWKLIFSQEKKIKENHAWFLDTVSLFKLPNLKSREALDASRLKIGVRQITVETDKKEAALKISFALVKIYFFWTICKF